ncbi:ATP-binding protein [Streptomyces sp. NPDC029526]|uniref:HAMP domain-containing sensor histidine kinase n=1 Tax=Streptomyces sp. NPDC029526 TaxID=3155728 RepID=UPI0033C3301A
MRPRLLSLGTTFAVSFAAVTASVTLLIGFLSYTAAARLVRVDQQSVFHEVVQDLRNEVRANHMTPVDFSSTAPGHDLVRPARTDVQVLGPDGDVFDPGDPGLPVGAADRRVAASDVAGDAVEHADVRVGDDLYRVATVSLGGGRGAVQVAQESSDTEDLLRTLQRRTLVLMAAVVLGAGLFGWWLARRITRRLVVLTRAAEDVTRTRRLGIQVPVAGHDEVGRLGRAFDRMLGRLAQSEEDQRRLVQDAGHELRTPLTSLRTNISLLRRIDELPPGTREELVADLGQEALELTDLVNELVELAAGQSDAEPPRRVDLAEVAEEVAALARRRTGRRIVVRASGHTVTDGRPGMLTRALSNLVENAVKFDRDGRAPVEIDVTGPDGAHGAEGPDQPDGLFGPGSAFGPDGMFCPDGPFGAGGPLRADGQGGRGGADAPDVPDGPFSAGGRGLVRVEVRDRGPGIADGDLLHVFDRFYRAADARSLPGSGLGLSIVREVALSHGGAPYAARRQGGGTVTGFTVGGVRPHGEE